MADSLDDSDPMMTPDEEPPRPRFANLPRRGSLSRISFSACSDDSVDWDSALDIPSSPTTYLPSESLPGFEDFHGKSQYDPFDKPNFTSEKTKNAIFPNGEIPNDKELEKSIPESLHYSPNKVWISVIAILTCYIIAGSCLMPLCTQYFADRIAEDDYNTTYDEVDKCGNVSSEKEERDEDIQKDASSKLLVMAFATGVPATLACLCVGSYSDFIGRKPLVIMSLVGAILRVSSLCAVIQFDLNLNWVMLGALCDGALGSAFTITLAGVAIIADISPDPHSRALRFSVVEGVLFMFGAISQVAVGYLIKEVSYIAPAVGCGSLLVLALLIALVCPETITVKAMPTWNPIVHIKKSFRFYFSSSESKSKRHQYLLGLSIFITLLMVGRGRPGVEMLYMLNKPFCWDAFHIGLYNALRMIAMALAAVTFLKLTKVRIPLEVAGAVAFLSGGAGFILEGVAQDDGGMILAVAGGILFMGARPVPRALMSQIASPAEQGALFSGMSTMETVFGTISSATYTVVYNSTVHKYRGFVFLVMAGFTVVGALLTLTYYHHRKRSGVTVASDRIDPPDIGPTYHHGPATVPEDIYSSTEQSPLLSDGVRRNSTDASFYRSFTSDA